jgi:hypothetical protein
MNSILEQLRLILQKKPIIHVITLIAYLLCAAFFKWTIHPVWNTLFFILGGLLGIYFLDGAEVFFKITPSPFKSILFFAALAVVMIFIVTSSGSAFASGLVITTYGTLLLWFGSEFTSGGNPNVWFSQLADPISDSSKKVIGGILFAVLFLATALFVR